MSEARFVGESITVSFDAKPVLEKKPGVPDRFEWRGDAFEIESVLREWHDYSRRGRAASNMRPTHAAAAEARGSWGVGRDYYRVRVTCGRVFEIYYDRAPRDVRRRKGEWFLFRELASEEDTA